MSNDIESQTLSDKIALVLPAWDGVASIAVRDVLILQVKDRQYGSSWKKRGGVGAYMMLARKWDRIETALKVPGTDDYRSIFSVGTEDKRKENILEDIADLRRYLLLVEDEIRRQRVVLDPSEAGTGYVYQDE